MSNPSHKAAARIHAAWADHKARSRTAFEAIRGGLIDIKEGAYIIHPAEQIKPLTPVQQAD